MPVKLQPTSVIKTRLGIEPNGRIHKFFTNECYKRNDKYVPKDKGDLRRESYAETDKYVYISPYAGYQYHGIRQDGTHEVKRYTTPGTGKYWDKLMISAEMSDIVKEVQNEIKRGGN